MSKSFRSRAVRLGATVSAATLAFVAAPALPAHAADPSVFVNPIHPTVQVGSHGAKKAVAFFVSAGNAKNPQLIIDTSKLSGVGTLTPRDTGACKTAGAKITCALPDGTYDTGVEWFTLTSAAGSTAGAKGSVDLATRADGFDMPSAGHLDVTIADGADLVAFPANEQDQPAKPGDTLWMQAVVFNEGNRPAAGTGAFVFFFDDGLVPDQYAGCTYGTWAFGIAVVCPFNRPIGPGDAVKFVTDDGTKDGHPGMSVRVAGTAGGHKAGVFLADPSAGKADPLSRLQARKATSGKRFGALAAQPKDLNEYDNLDEATWNIASTRDVAALGATASGKVGDVVKVTVGAKNVGPSTIDVSHTGGEPSWSFDFVVPEGTEVLDVPANCLAWSHGDNGNSAEPVPGGRFYECGNHDQLFAPGESFTAEFRLKITQVIAGSTGTVSFNNTFLQYERKDDNPANDIAEVVINPTGNGGGEGGGLPVTGAKTATVAVVGALLLAGGAALFVTARRRRIVLVAPKDGGVE
ncbi:LPXTG cell wall anchor domain-containing protein [Dactylosporangium sp. NPDC048998]|uniref:LPXTG cell wall anchor domain-containing protein n=1 Tax=Dactylosporangium sp. NPDC048998 TaxID=3363976 RepID=UPI00371BF097